MARLTDEQFFKIHAELLGPGGIESVLGVDERSDTTFLLSVGDDMQSQRRLAARFRAEQFDDSAAWKSEAAHRQIERQRAGRDAGDFHVRHLVGQLHNRPFSERLFDLSKGIGQGGILLGRFIRFGNFSFQTHRQLLQKMIRRGAERIAACTLKTMPPPLLATRANP